MYVPELRRRLPRRTAFITPKTQISAEARPSTPRARDWHLPERLNLCRNCIHPSGILFIMISSHSEIWHSSIPYSHLSTSVAPYFAVPFLLCCHGLHGSQHPSCCVEVISLYLYDPLFPTPLKPFVSALLPPISDSVTPPADVPYPIHYSPSQSCMTSICI